MLSKDIQFDITKSCKVILFLDRHDDAAKTFKSLISLLPFFSQQGFRTFCFESFLDMSQEIMYNMQVSALKDTCDTNLCEVLADGAELRNDIILTALANHILYCAMDKKPRNPTEGNDFIETFGPARDEHMAKVIFEKCALGNVLVSVGFAHHQGIRQELLKLNLLDKNVKGYYAPSLPAEKYTTKWDTFERNLRSVEEAYFEHKDDNIAVIDLLKDNTLNITDIIIESYKKHFVVLDNVDQEPDMYTELQSLVQDLYDFFLA